VWIRNGLAPSVLIVQIVDIACWWLARLDGQVGIAFAKAIVATGSVVGVALGSQILLGLFDLFGKIGKVLIVLLVLLAGFGSFLLNEHVFQPHLNQERESSTTEFKAPEGP
jgi:hypothetical protein